MARKVYIGVNEFTQPILTANGTLGGNSFAVSASNITTGYEAWRAFSSNASIAYSSSVNPSSQTIYYTIYNPAAIKITNIAFTNVPSGLTSSSPSTGSIQGSNNNSSWTTITNFTNTNNINSSTWSVNLNPSTYYKYYRIVITGANTTQAYVNIGKIKLTAEYASYSYTLNSSNFQQAPYLYATGVHDTNYSSNYISTKDYFEVSPGSSVVITANVTLSADSGFLWYDNSKSFISGNIANSISGSSMTGIAPNTASYFKFNINAIGITPSSITNVFVNTSASVARNVKKMYVGVNGKARRVKKGYIGIGGVARPFFGGNAVEYYGEITSLSEARSSLATTVVGDYALFGGGTARVDAYNKSLTRSIPTELREYYGEGRSYLAATTVGNYALFGGGGYYYNGSHRIVNYVDIYDSSLTKETPSALSDARKILAATTIGDYALFGGGMSYHDVSGSDENSALVDAYNSSLTLSSAAELSTARNGLAAVTIGNYALFAGGSYENSSGSTVLTIAVDTYNKSLTKGIATSVSIGGDIRGATTVGTYALFKSGGTLDVYNTSLTKSSILLAVNYSCECATSLGKFALFYNSSDTETINCYDTSLTETIITTPLIDRSDLAAITINGYALFGGGYSYTDWSSKSTVSAYVIA